MAFLDACEPEHLQTLNMRPRQLQTSGHGATEHGPIRHSRKVMNIASQHPGHHLLWDARHSPSESVAGPARSPSHFDAHDSLNRSLASASRNIQVHQSLPAPGVSFGTVTPLANLSNVSLEHETVFETRGQFQPPSPRALLGTLASMHVYQHSGTLQPRLHGETNTLASAAEASAGQMTQKNKPHHGPHVPSAAASGGIAGRGAPRAPRKRATFDSRTVLQIFSTRNDPSSCNAWATALGVTSKAVRDVWNLRTWRQ